MSRTISVRLRTLCGCTQYLAIPGPAPQTYEVLIGAEHVPPGDGVVEDVVLRVRRFRLKRLSPSDLATEADYEEVP